MLINFWARREDPVSDAQVLLHKDHGLEEATSTRALVYAASMMNAGLDPVAACQVAMINPITDDIELAEAMMEIVQAHFAA